MGARPQEPKLITLDEWADRMYGAARPHRNTLTNWRKNGWIYPTPVKQGNRIWVSPNAVCISDDSEVGELAQRIRNGG